MSILDMSDALDGFEQPTTLKTKRTFTVDFEEFEECTDSIISAVIQPAQKEDLNIDNIDWSKSYILAHSVEEFKINDVITWCGMDYKIISMGNFKDYCYYEGVGEEVKK